MRITDDQIKKFQELHKLRFGVELSKEEATEKAQDLIKLVQLVYKPIKKLVMHKYET